MDCYYSKYVSLRRMLMPNLPLNRVFSSSCLHLQASRPQMKRWIDSFGEVYSKAVIAATLVILLVLPMLGVPMLGSATQSGAFYRAMGFLTAASPCALVLVPLAYVSAIGAVTSRQAIHCTTA